MSVVGFYGVHSEAFPDHSALAVRAMVLDDEFEGTNESWNFCGQGKGLEDHAVATALIGVATWWAMNTASDSRL
jgi:hypothetical protein